MSEIPIFSHSDVMSAVSPSEAIERVEHGFVEHAAGEWAMPPKVYLDVPNGDFRAMPARGGGIAILKWVTSFTHNPARGLPVVQGLICVSDEASGSTKALVDVRAVTALRTGAVAAVAARALAREDSRTLGIVGCGHHGAWAARCLAADEYGPGVCYDPDPDAAGALAGELGWEVGSREDALACDVVTFVTPGAQPAVHAGEVRAGTHLNMLGADGAGKAEAEIEVVERARLFCDEWAQASHGGELAGAVAAGRIEREQVAELGAVLTGSAPGRSSQEEITLFDSTGLAIQDVALCLAVLAAADAGAVKPALVTL